MPAPPELLTYVSLYDQRVTLEAQLATVIAQMNSITDNTNAAVMFGVSPSDPTRIYFRGAPTNRAALVEYRSDTTPGMVRIRVSIAEQA